MATIAFSTLLVLCVFSVNNRKIKADGCPFSKPSNLQISNNTLTWTGDAQVYTVSIYDGSKTSFFDQLTTAEFLLLGDERIDQAGSYVLNVWAGNGSNECSDSDNVAKMEITVREMNLTVLPDDTDSMYVYGNKASLAYGGLAVDTVNINYTVVGGYKPVVKDSGGTTVEPLSKTDSLLVVDASKFTDRKVTVEFVEDPIITEVDLGEKHKAIAEYIADKVDRVTLDGTKIICSFLASSSMEASILKTFLYATISGYIFDKNGTAIDDNEMLLWLSGSSNVSSAEAITEEMYTDESTVGSLNGKLYPVWMRYEADGSKTWTVGSSSGLLFTITRNISDGGYENTTHEMYNISSTFSSFAGKITIEKKGSGSAAELDAGNYETAVGSLKVTLKNDYLKTLDKGEYTLRVYFNTGLVSHDFSAGELYAETTFKIEDPSVDPAPTPDSGSDSDSSTPTHRLPRTGIE